MGKLRFFCIMKLKFQGRLILSMFKRIVILKQKFLIVSMEKLIETVYPLIFPRILLNGKK